MDFDFGDSGGGDALGDLIASNEASGWDGNWVGGEDFLSGMDAAETFPVSEHGALGQAAIPEGSPNVGSPTEAELRTVSGPGTMGDPAAASGGGGKSLGAKLSSLFEDKKGDLDVNKLLKFGLGLGSFVNSLSNRNKANSNQLQQQLQQQRNSAWTPQQSVWAQYFQTPTNFDRPRVAAASMPSPIVASRGYAGGGSVGPQDIWNVSRRRREQEAGTQDYTPQTLQPGTNRVIPEGKRVPVSDLLRSVPLLLKSLFESDNSEAPKKDYAEGGGVMPDIFSGFVSGQGGGQSDIVQANLAPGEYVLDADVVSAVGDGSNEEGARILDEWREMVRSAKREAPAGDIPPSMEETGIQLPMPGAGEQ